MVSKNVSTEGKGHATTIIGFSTYGGINQITFYNPGTDKVTSVEYLNSGTKYIYNSYVFKWVDTCYAVK